jgi:hypothetical protein
MTGTHPVLGFAALPGEIREIVYSMLYRSEIPIKLITNGCNLMREPAQNALDFPVHALALSKDFNKEAGDTLYGRNIFSIDFSMIPYAVLQASPVCKKIALLYLQRSETGRWIETVQRIQTVMPSLQALELQFHDCYELLGAALQLSGSIVPCSAFFNQPELWLCASIVKQDYAALDLPTQAYRRFKKAGDPGRPKKLKDFLPVEPIYTGAITRDLTPDLQVVSHGGHAEFCLCPMANPDADLSGRRDLPVATQHASGAQV